MRAVMVSMSSDARSGRASLEGAEWQLDVLDSAAGSGWCSHSSGLNLSLAMYYSYCGFMYACGSCGRKQARDTSLHALSIWTP